MASAVRDRSARSRIRDYLARHGSLEDPNGRATSRLKEAVGYDGSAVAFIQLVTAMDKADEIKREIRGKRTYRISAVGASAASAPRPSRPKAVASVAAPAAVAVDLDYDQLARALLREVWRVAGSAQAPAAVSGVGSLGTVGADGNDSLDAVRLERDRLQVERNEYARRLQVARLQLRALLNDSLPDGDDVDLANAGGGIEQAS
jgi:hypothetical protein